VRRGIGIRWWLTLAFALIAAVTAVAVFELFALRSEGAFRERAQELAAGNALQAAIELARAGEGPRLTRALDEVARRRRLALFLYSQDGTLASAPRSRDVSIETLRLREEAVEAALAGQRFVRTNDAVRATTVGLPFRAGEDGALVAFAYHPDLAAGLGILREEIVVAALWAVLLGGAVGFLVASLISIRLRRIGRAAAAIEAGDLRTPLRPGFGDELGALGATIERMRERLRESFRALASERDRLEQLVDRLREGVLSVHSDLTVELANDAARRMLSTPRLRAGDQVPDPWPALSLRRFATRLFGAGAEATEGQVTIESEKTLALAGLPPHPGSATAIIVIVDISERERRERAEREFVANAAHELRTPLTTIVGAVEALQGGAKHDAEERDRFLAHVEREAARLARLTRALLVLARAETGQEPPLLAPVRALPLLEEVRARLTPAEGVSVEIECDPDLTLFSEQDLLEEALSNLAANAARHTARGRIVLAARSVDADTVELEVTDTGRGIPPAEQERVFERFYRGNGRDADGFGLGLPIVHRTVQALGGRIDLHSVPGSGTRVRVALPAAGREGR
jgi:signal transduction histidine kinase/HAMP domain-containing protein